MEIHRTRTNLCDSNLFYVADTNFCDLQTTL